MGQHSAKEFRGSRRGESNSGVFPLGPGHAHVGMGSTKKPLGIHTSAVQNNVLRQRNQHRRVMHEEGGSHPRGQEADGSHGEDIAEEKFPVVIRYAAHDVRSLLSSNEKVYVAVESLNWSKLPMTASEDSFYAIVELPQGPQRFRFVVGETEVVDTAQPIEDIAEGTPLLEPRGDVGHKGETRANVIHVNKALLLTKEDEEVPDDGSGWGQEEIIHKEDRKHPPIMPVHLRYTPVNTPLTAARCALDGFMRTTDEDTVSPENLPIPLSVTVNHVYFQRREDHCVTAMTTRFCNKYSTMVYYSKAEPTASLQ
ncbi:hypothetical protein, conserved [Trypanosoma brucei brucei TREU927]|uniref:Association with the SNF1 complex (ASC) domain-containing protein n=1 Tax=Trypanosoma brucei brucei (strain 927/4 GUTat10.1) TaxID=185431 RepID=Q57XE4_TRYB2|nr:hypothetical protein, conserved [Trypanosoma brucei brucei TREU927]AAX69707.1 hypothetical protein, conserved [Trypanosoma brucei]AAZ13012.1 hypothetical protein, conserved [Trypanosoma brucei brucei TREU927]